MTGLKTGSLFGAKKEYWSYFQATLDPHDDTIAIVNQHAQSHKTPIGKGRCFIRVALANKRLAECVQVSANSEAAMRGTLLLSLFVLLLRMAQFCRPFQFHTHSFAPLNLR